MVSDGGYAEGDGGVPPLGGTEDTRDVSSVSQGGGMGGGMGVVIGGGVLGGDGAVSN